MRNDGILRHIESTLDNEVKTIDTLPEFIPTSILSVAILFGYVILFDLLFVPFAELLQSRYRKKSKKCRFF